MDLRGGLVVSVLAGVVISGFGLGGWTDSVEKTEDVDAPAGAWSPAPSFDTLSDIATDAQALMADGVPQVQAFQRATESHGLQYQQVLDPVADWFTPEQIENCDYVYWYLTDTYVNACDPWTEFLSGKAPASAWMYLLAGNVYEQTGGFGFELLGNVPGYPVPNPGLIGMNGFGGGAVIGAFSGGFNILLDGTLAGEFIGSAGPFSFEEAFTGSPFAPAGFNFCNLDCPLLLSVLDPHADPLLAGPYSFNGMVFATDGSSYFAAPWIEGDDVVLANELLS